MKTIVAVTMLCAFPLLGADSIPSPQAKDHVGETEWQLSI
jgi:hypothetical protein